ncbi:MAG: histidine kinase sensor domain-containing protein [Pseudomonadota bacterium]
MTRKLLWKLCLIMAAGIVALFYVINYVSLRVEEDMSMIRAADRSELRSLGAQAERFHAAGDVTGLESWLEELKTTQGISAAVVSFEFNHLAGETEFESKYQGYNLGRSLEWQIHLYFEENPVMEIPFENGLASFVVQLPPRMRPGGYWPATRVALHVVIPLSLLVLLTLLLYRHIMVPLRQLQRTTQEFSSGSLDARVGDALGNRDDEISELANTFDQMASRISGQLVSQRQLIADLSHELRTPLTRLDIAITQALSNDAGNANLSRIERESEHIRKLVEDSLALAWLENEQPQLERENIDLVDLIDVIVDDAKFEFPDHQISANLPSSAQLKNSNHRSLGQALENIIRNALRYTPQGESVNLNLDSSAENQYTITIEDNGPGVPANLLELIFQPFYRIDPSRNQETDSFGLGLALARRQLHAIGGKVFAKNRIPTGLCMSVVLPKQ